MYFHDARKILDVLRNHLTQPETNVAFLFGAGTSSAVQVERTETDADGNEVKSSHPLIPNVAELTNICARAIRKLDPAGEPPKFANALAKIEAETNVKDRPVNIEDILSCVRRKQHAIGLGDVLSGLMAEELELLEKTIRQSIAAQVNPDRSSFPEKLPHEDFVRWIARMPRKHPVEIFTTNYDILLETALEAERVHCFDGFVGCNRPFFSNDSLNRPESAPGSTWARLWKVHGSINWKLDTVRGRVRVVRGEPHNEGQMIMPSHHKYDESRKQPYSALLDRMSRVLDREDTILFVCGYSFSDDHINAIIFDALEAKRRPHVIALQYADVSPEAVIADRATRYLNFVVLGPTNARIGGKLGSWRAADGDPEGVLAGAFTVPAAAAHGEATDPIRFHLGDFVHFSRFLASLTGPT